MKLTVVQVMRLITRSFVYTRCGSGFSLANMLMSASAEKNVYFNFLKQNLNSTSRQRNGIGRILQFSVFENQTICEYFLNFSGWTQAFVGALCTKSRNAERS